MTDQAGLSATPRATRRLLLPAVTALVVVGDVATKRLAEAHLIRGEATWLVDGWVGLELRFNSGVAFSLLDGRRGVWVLSTVAVVGLVWLVRDVADRSASLLGRLPAAAITGGAAGNLIDRIGDGRVTDFVAIGPWPRFNVADSSLTIGLVLLLVQAVTTKGHDPDDRRPDPYQSD